MTVSKTGDANPRPTIRLQISLVLQSACRVTITEPFESEIATRYSGNAIFSESFAADVTVLSY